MNEKLGFSHPLKAIASKFETHESRIPTPALEKMVDQKQSETSGTHCPVLSPQLIQAPTLLIDNELRIVWQNEAAKTQLWQLTEIEDDTHAYLFDLLLSAKFRNTVTNWREWLAFFIRQAQPLISSQELQQAVEQRNETERELLKSLFNDPESVALIRSQKNSLRQIIRGGSAHVTYWVIGTTFDKGRLLVFEKKPENAADQTTVKTVDVLQRFAMIRQQSVPVKRPFYALVARLNRADTLRAEMLEEEYSRLLHRLWGDVVETIEKNGGIVVQYAGDGLMGLFLPAEDGSDHNPLFVIQCALELKSHMGELGREWKIRTGWLHDIELNIGIDAGDEYLVTLPSALGENLIPAGDTVQVAGFLANLAVDGQIWTTKALINQIPSQDLKDLRFGVFRNDTNRQIFITKSFWRIREISAKGSYPFDLEGDLGARPVTQIFDRSFQG